MWGRSPIRICSGTPPFPLGPEEDNRFGTDEFMDLCRTVGAEPSLTASLGANDPDEAVGWVAYIRDRYGAGAVPTWSVGNEQWNIIEPGGLCFQAAGSTWNASTASPKPCEALIRRSNSSRPEATRSRSRAGTRRSSRASARPWHLLSLHLYMPGWSPLRSHVGNSLGDYYAISAAGLAMEEQIQLHRGNGGPPARHDPAHRR